MNRGRVLSRLVILALVVGVAASCGGGAPAAERNADISTLAATTSVGADQSDDPLADGVVTVDEYRAAFDAFVACVEGVGEVVEIYDRDPVSGAVSYGTYTMLSIGSTADPTNLCYNEHFARVEMVFQMTDPTFLAVQEQREAESFELYGRPCLESIGVSVPPAEVVAGDGALLQELRTRTADAHVAGDCQS